MKVAHSAEKQNYEGQLSDLRGEYTKTKDELDGEIMVTSSKSFPIVSQTPAVFRC